MNPNIQKRKRIYRCVLLCLLLIVFGAISCHYYTAAAKKIPTKLILYKNRTESFNLGFPFYAKLSSDDAKAVSLQNDVKSTNNARSGRKIQAVGNHIGSYKAGLSLFGVIPCGSLTIDVVPETKVMPAGNAVGIYLESDGIMVLGTSDVQGNDGFMYHPAKNIINAGDYLLAINETSVQNIQQVASLLQKNGSKTVTLKIRRNNKDLQIKLNPIATKDGSYSLGIWLREDTEGIGTMTCVLENNTFAALGHGITDVDTGLLIELNNGGLYQATVNKIVSGKKGTPGELSGIVHLNNNNKIGSVLTNNHWGISGKVSDHAYQYQEEKGISLALKQEIKTGKASIRCQLGKEIRDYEIMIDKVQMNAKDNKDLVLRVTDPELLRKTGGIVQGMSGSPILQNGKLIGAVTHVFVNNPRKGYGIFIEDMLTK